MNIRDFLIGNGVYPNLKGFHPLIRAVEIVKEKKQVSMTKELYPALAKEFNTSASKVERAIRNILTSKISISSYAAIGFVKKPTNSEVIYFFANQLVKGGAKC